MLKNTKKKGLSTRAIHAGQEPDKSTGAIMVPIYATSTYIQKSPGEHLGFEYSRTLQYPIFTLSLKHFQCYFLYFQYVFLIL